MTQLPDFSVKPVLAGEKAVLRPFRADDLPAMCAVLLDPEARILTGGVRNEADAHAPLTAPQERVLKAWYDSRGDQDDRLDLAVTDKATGECVGEVVLNGWDQASESCNYRILLGPRGRDRGLGTEATRLIAGYGFAKLGLHRISVEVYAFNPRARRACEKAGFHAEGVLRDAHRYNGKWIDAVVLSALASEWPAEAAG